VKGKGRKGEGFRKGGTGGHLSKIGSPDLLKGGNFRERLQGSRGSVLARENRRGGWGKTIKTGGRRSFGSITGTFLTDWGKEIHSLRHGAKGVKPKSLEKKRDRTLVGIDRGRRRSGGELKTSRTKRVTRVILPPAKTAAGLLTIAGRGRKWAFQSATFRNQTDQHSGFKRWNRTQSWVQGWEDGPAKQNKVQ